MGQVCKSAPADAGKVAVAGGNHVPGLKPRPISSAPLVDARERRVGGANHGAEPKHRVEPIVLSPRETKTSNADVRVVSYNVLSPGKNTVGPFRGHCQAQYLDQSVRYHG